MPHEAWVEGGRLWISNPNLHPQRLEWLRYADPPADDEDAAFRAAPHIAYTVESLEDALDGKDVILPPADLGFALAAFTHEDGVIVEYLQIHEGRNWFDDEVEQGA
jgi:hypothetical protein